MKWSILAAVAALFLFAGSASAATHYYHGHAMGGPIVTSHPNYGWNVWGYHPGGSTWRGGSSHYYRGYGYGSYYSTGYYPTGYYSTPYYQPYRSYYSPSPNVVWSGGYYCN